MRKTSPNNGPNNRPPLGSPRSTFVAVSELLTATLRTEPSDPRTYSNPVLGTGDPRPTGPTPSLGRTALQTRGFSPFEPLGSHALAGMDVDVPGPSGAGVDELVGHAGGYYQDLAPVASMISSPTVKVTSPSWITNTSA